MAVSETGHLAPYVRNFAKSLGGQFLPGVSVILKTEIRTEKSQTERMCASCHLWTPCNLNVKFRNFDSKPSSY